MTNDDWKQTQNDLRAGVYGPWEIVRSMLCAEASERYPDQGISSSDVNHMVYGWAKGREPLHEESSEHALKLWREGSIERAYDVIEYAA